MTLGDWVALALFVVALVCMGVLVYEKAKANDEYRKWLER